MRWLLKTRLPALSDVFRHFVGEAGAGLAGVPGDVGGEEDALRVLRVEVGMVQGDGFLLVDVDADAGDAALVDGADQIGLHRDAAAARVHQEGRRFHLAEALVVDEPCGALVVGCVDADDVGFPEEFVQAHAGVVLAMPGAGGGVVDDFHPEGRADGGHLLADGAHAHDAERLPEEFREGMVRIDMDAPGAVAAVARVGVVVEGEAREVEDMHPGGLGDRFRRIPRHVPDDDAPLVAELHVDVVDAGPGLADEPDLRAGVQEGLVHDDLVEKDDVGVRRADAGLFGRGGRVEDEFAQGGDLRHRRVAHRGGVQENDFHDCSVLVQI